MGDICDSSPADLDNDELDYSEESDKKTNSNDNDTELDVNIFVSLYIISAILIKSAYSIGYIMSNPFSPTTA